MESLWTQRTQLARREKLNGSIKTDICVIGSGMAGCCCAWQLQQAGFQVVIVEAARIAQGQTAGTTAKISLQMDGFYEELLQKQGKEKAKATVELYQNALKEYERIVEEQHIDCQFEHLPAVLYSKKNPQKLQKEEEAAKQLGIEAVYQEDAMTPDGMASILRFENQAQFDPLRFLAALTEKLTIYECSPVLRVEDQTVITESGTVQAQWILFATHFPTINLPGFYFMKMHQERSHVLVLKSVPNPGAMFYGIDDDGYSFRWDRNLLIMTGAAYRTGENRSGGQYQKLINKAAELFPENRIMLAWSAQDCMTLDGLPYIGQYSHDHPHWLVATGFNKWGMIHSMAAALLLKERILGKNLLAAQVFDSLRSMFREPTVFLQEAMQATEGLLREWLEHPSFSAEELPLEHGGAVTIEGKKIGVYKDRYGDVYAVSLRCPHLGCQLEWNPDEKSWDCPCHGSRFDYHGRLIDGPAQKNLEATVMVNSKK